MMWGNVGMTHPPGGPAGLVDRPPPGPYEDRMTAGMIVERRPEPAPWHYR